MIKIMENLLEPKTTHRWATEIKNLNVESFLFQSISLPNYSVEKRLV